ncbi:MAG: RNA 2',3'-cyclic phosphodiesterase [Nitrospinota bacterium]
MESVRAFIAAQIGDKLREALSGVIDELKKSDPYVKWIKPENLHVTLKFLGEVEADKIDAIKSEMQNIAASDKPFSLSVSGIGVIPNPRYPRVVYSNLVDNDQKLKNLSQRLDEAMTLLGFEPEERDFLPHLTIGRVKSFKAKSLLIMKIREFHKREIGTLDVRSVRLIKSELMPAGAIYTEMANAALGTEGGTDV